MTQAKNLAREITLRELEVAISVIVFEINCTRRTGENYCPFEIVTGQCPDFFYRPLSINLEEDANAYSEYISERIENIRREVAQKLLQNNDEDDSTDEKAGYLKVGDIVRLKVNPKPNTPKRLVVKFSIEKYVITEINYKFNTAKLQLIEETGKSGQLDARKRSPKLIWRADGLKRIGHQYDVESKKLPTKAISGEKIPSERQADATSKPADRRECKDRSLKDQRPCPDRKDPTKCEATQQRYSLRQRERINYKE